MTDERKQQFYAHVLRSMESAVGRKLTADEVVDAARAVDHPLHDYFEWDDAKAGARHRLEQARHLIYTVRLPVTSRGNLLPHTIPAYVRDMSAGDRQGMVAVEEVIGDTAKAKAAFRYERQRLSAYLQRVQALAFAYGFENEFNALLDEFRIRVDHGDDSSDDAPRISVS